MARLFVAFRDVVANAGRLPEQPYLHSLRIGRAAALEAVSGDLETAMPILGCMKVWGVQDRFTPTTT